jgi:hypothetical protein
MKADHEPWNISYMAYSFFKSIIMAMEQNFEAISEKLMCTKSVVN